jgi:4-aminobutyrate aminotransferase-like enzyme
MGSYLMRGLKDLEDRYETVGEVRSRSLMIGIEMVVDGATKASAGPGRARHGGVPRARMLIGKGGLYGNTLRLSPPLTITEDDAARAIETLEVAFGEVEAAR